MYNTPLIIIVMGLILSGCHHAIRPEKPAADSKVKAANKVPGPPCIIYRTRADYSRLVAVELSADRKRVVSYPAVQDIRLQGDKVYPVELTGGFLLDNRGIGPGVAFLKISYEDYIRRESTPRAEELFEIILDDDPLLEMYDCGNRSSMSDPVSELNGILEKKDFSGLKKLR